MTREQLVEVEARRIQEAVWSDTGSGAMDATMKVATELCCLRAENERLSKAVVGGILGELLTENETDALVAFVKSLRSPEDRSLRVGGEQ